MTARRWRAELALAAAALLGFGPYLHWRGFYVDDWTQMLGMMANLPDQSLPGLVRGLWTEYYYSRPLNIVYYALSYWLGGLHAWRYQLAYVAMDGLSAVLIYRALRAASGDERLAFLSALLFCLFPNHSGSRFWNNQVHPAQLLFAAAMLAHARGRRGVAAASMLASGLNYEAFVPLAPMAVWLELLRGHPLKLALRRSWPVLAGAAAAAAYSVAAPRLFPSTVLRVVVFDPSFALKVLGKGLECSSGSIVHLLWTVGPQALRDLWPGLLWLAMPACAWLAGWAAALEARKVKRPWLWPAGGALILAAGYLPFAFSADRYLPHIFDMQNRLNAAPSLGAAILLAFALRRLDLTRRVLLGAVLAAFLILDWQASHEWGRAGRLQREILAGVSADYAKVKRKPHVYVLDAPQYLGNAPVFVNDVEFNGAVKSFVAPELTGATVYEGRSILAKLPPEMSRRLYRHVKAAQ